MSRGAIWRAFMEEQKRRREDEAGFAPPAYKIQRLERLRLPPQASGYWLYPHFEAA